MSFQIIAGRHPQDKDFPSRNHSLSVRLALLNGEFYRHQKYAFHEDYAGFDYVPLQDRAPNVPTGTTQLRTIIDDHVSMLFGDGQFPEIDTENVDARVIAKDLIRETGLVERMREAARLGSVGSVALHLKVLQKPGAKARLFVDVYSTEFLTVAYDPYQPDVVETITEKLKAKGRALRDAGYAIPDDNLNVDYWCQRVWDNQAELWFVPWLVHDDSKPADYEHIPVEDAARTVKHGLGFCPWEWIGGLRTVDGPCTFEAGIETAIQIDMLDSQITRALKYTMDPTLMIKVPGTIPQMAPSPETPESTGATPQGQGMAKTPSTILRIDAEGDAEYLEIAGGGLEQAQLHVKRLKSALIEMCHGDRVDPVEVTNGHQGAKSLEMLNASLLMHTAKQRITYGNPLLRLLRMALRVIEAKSVSINGKVVVLTGDWSDLTLRWGDFYSLTPAEEAQVGTALTALITAGVMSKETATKTIGAHYDIENVAAERAKIEAEQAETDARAEKQAAHAASLKPSQTKTVAD